MAQFDLPIEELRSYVPEESEPADFDAFWSRTLEETRSHSLDARFDRVDEPIHQLVDVYDVRFAGFGGHPIQGWFLEPAGNTGTLPCLVHFVGYGGGRSLPLDHLAAPVAGFARLGLPDRFIAHGSRQGQLAEAGIDAAGIAGSVQSLIEEGEANVPRSQASAAARQAGSVFTRA